ncbi:MAG: hypothetical protein GY749_13460 [Desulfobacteraceae bacterium]|nr:hypothetical protein [Desulfobacteraceae bacterium]
MSFVDPEPVLQEMYERELVDLRQRFGDPMSRSEQREFDREDRRLRMHIFGTLPRITNW